MAGLLKTMLVFSFLLQTSAQHRRLRGIISNTGSEPAANETVIPNSSNCEPDPVCSIEGRHCRCCYKWICDFEDPCRCGATESEGILPAHTCKPDPKCSRDDQGLCQCQYNCTISVKDDCRCAAT